MALFVEKLLLVFCVFYKIAKSNAKIKNAPTRVGLGGEGGIMAQGIMGRERMQGER